MSLSRRGYAAVSPAKPAPRMTTSAFDAPRFIAAPASPVVEAGRSFLREGSRPFLQVGGQLDQPVERLIQADPVGPAQVAPALGPFLCNAHPHGAARSAGVG